MYDDKLSRACEIAFEPILEEYSVCDEVSEKHRFSDAFEEKMKVAVSAPKPKHRIKKLSWRLIIAAVLIFSSGLCIGAARLPIHDLIMTVIGNRNDIIVNNKTGDERIGLGKIYVLTSIPQDYRLINSYICADSANSCYSNGKNTFTFLQYKDSAYKDAYVNDSIKSEYITDENEQEYLILSDDESASVIWHKDGYVFIICGNIDKDDLLKLCKSTKLK